MTYTVTEIFWLEVIVGMVDIEAATIVLTGAGVIVAIVYGILTLRDTSRTRQAELYMAIYGKASTLEFYDDFELYVDRSQWNNFNEYWEMFKKDPSFRAAAIRLHSFYEGLGVLVKENLLDIRFVALFFAYYTRRLWEKVSVSTYEGRKVLGIPRWGSETEYLYKELMKYVERHPELKT